VVLIESKPGPCFLIADAAAAADHENLLAAEVSSFVVTLC
jgi:hypothetical protein